MSRDTLVNPLSPSRNICWHCSVSRPVRVSRIVWIATIRMKATIYFRFFTDIFFSFIQLACRTGWPTWVRTTTSARTCLSGKPCSSTHSSESQGNYNQLNVLPKLYNHAKSFIVTSMKIPRFHWDLKVIILVLFNTE